MNTITLPDPVTGIRIGFSHCNFRPQHSQAKARRKIILPITKHRNLIGESADCPNQAPKF